MIAVFRVEIVHRDLVGKQLGAAKIWQLQIHRTAGQLLHLGSEREQQLLGFDHLANLFFRLSRLPKLIDS